MNREFTVDRRKDIATAGKTLHVLIPFLATEQTS